MREIEIATHVPKRFRYPFFAKLCWYAAEKYLRDLKAKEDFPPRVLESIEALADFLVHESRTMEKGSEQGKREAKDAVPGDRVKDAPALARELRWRVRLAEGCPSDEDVSSRNMKKRKALATNGDTASTSANKRKRASEDHEDAETSVPSLFKNFQPKGWDVVRDSAGEEEEATMRVKRIDDGSDGWKDVWSQEVVESSEDGEEARMKRRRNVLVKVRRTAKGLERHRVERVVEEWSWEEGTASEAEAMEVEMNGHTGAG